MTARAGRSVLEELERGGVASLRARMQARPVPVAGAQPKRRRTPERDAQRAVVAWLRKAGCLVQATFTEQAARARDPEKRARFGAARKASGATTGWPDLTCVTPHGRVVFIEMKAARTGRLSQAQREVQADMRRRGCIVLLGTDIWSVQAAMEAAGISLDRAPAPQLRRAP